MSKINFKPVLYLFLAFMVSSCSSYKNIPYLQNQTLKDSLVITLPSQVKSSQVRYKQGDVLGITVNANTEPSIVADFNLPMQPTATPDDTGINQETTQGHGRQTYMVDQSGFIDFPILGQVKVENLTREELEQKLKVSLKTYLKIEPVVTIRLLNYKISVLGEVNHPGQYPVSRDHISLIEALSLAGDMTIYGRRDNVRLMRELPSGETQIIRLDLSDAWVASSPYFYLQQNDVLYVEPNKTKAKNSDIGAQTSIWFSLGSMALSIASLVFLITKK